MSISSGIGIASGGIAAIESQLAVLSQNIANASTPGYSVEVSPTQDVAASGQPEGVQAAPAQIVSDEALQASVFTQNAEAGYSQTMAAGLSAVTSVQGSPGSGSDLSSLLGGVQSAFTTLASDPSNQTQQSAVVTAAGNLASAINVQSAAYQAQRQDAQNAVVADIGTLNSTVATIGSLTSQIVNVEAQGQSTADLQNQRNAAIDTLSSLIDVKVLNQPNGGITLLAGGSLTIPLNGNSPPFATQPATVSAGASYPNGGIPPITLDGQDVTDELTGGSLGANIALRDDTLPTYQAELDEFAAQLSNRFAAQGLTLFSDANGNVPTLTATPPVQSGYVGYAGEIQVNPAVQQDPSLVRDGTQAVAGSATGASAFTPNPAGGPAGFDTLISRVLDYALGSQAQAGVAQPVIPTTALGASGTLSAGFATSTDLGGYASAMVASQATESANASDQAKSDAAVQTSLQSSLSAATGVSVDTELATMTQLQNAYGANAQVIAAAKAMWNDFITAVQAT